MLHVNQHGSSIEGMGVIWICACIYKDGFITPSMMKKFMPGSSTPHVYHCSFLFHTHFTIMLLLLLSILALAIVPFHPSEATFGEPKAGMILHAGDSKTRSGLLSSDHSCVEYPSKFPAHTAQNVGNTHCGLWTDKNCTGSLYVVPAHYAINMPGDAYGSVIC